jgi:hypothetical protein
MSDQTSSHRLSEHAADLVVRLTAAGAELLRTEDAYHLAVLTHGRESEEVGRASQDRTHVRETYRHLLAAAVQAFEAVTH